MSLAVGGERLRRPRESAVGPESGAANQLAERGDPARDCAVERRTHWPRSASST